MRHIGVEELKLSSLLYDIIMHKNPKESIKLQLDLIREFNKFRGYKISLQNSGFFFCILGTIRKWNSRDCWIYNSIKTIKYIRYSLTKCVLDLYSKTARYNWENFKRLGWIQRYAIFMDCNTQYIVKMSVLPK